MKCHLPLLSKRAALVCLSGIALSCGTQQLLADNIIYDGQKVEAQLFYDQDLENSSWEGAEVSSWFIQCDLTNANFTNANLRDSIFAGTTFDNARFDGASINGVAFGGEGVGLSEIGKSFTHDMLKSTASYENDDLSNIDFTGSDFQGFSFNKINLTNTVLFATNLQGAQFDGAIITGASFVGMMQGQQGGFTRVMLESTQSWENMNLAGVDFTSNVMNGLQVAQFDLQQSDFFYAALIGSNFQSANLSQSRLANSTAIQSSFNGADLSHSVLVGGDFTGSDFTGADFTGADLRAANLSEVKGFDASQHHNLIGSDGIIQNVKLDSASDKLLLTDDANLDVYLSDGSIISLEDALPVTLTQNTIISNGATLEIEGRCTLVLTENTQLTLSATSRFEVSADVNSGTHNVDGVIFMKEGAAVTMEQGAHIDITLTALFDEPDFQLALFGWESPVAFDETYWESLADAIRINGKALDDISFDAVYDAASMTFGITGDYIASEYIIPEPSTTTLSLLALSGLLMRRRRKV